jgi:hypothetical protein
MKDHQKYSTPISYFSGNHLSEEGLALAAEAMESQELESLPEEIQDHLGDCQECREGVSDIYQIILQSGMQDEKGMRPFFEKGAGYKQTSRRLYWLRYAAVFLLLATSLGWLGLRLFSPEHPALRKIASVFGIEYYDPFAPDPLVETLVGAIFREDDFQLLAPAPTDTLVPGDLLHLQYTGYHLNALQFKLMTNQGQEVETFEVKGGAAMLRLPETQGLYYWRLSDGSDLLFLGRIILREPEQAKN